VEVPITVSVYDREMCSNYRPVTRGDWMLTYFGVERDFGKELPPEAWPTGIAPFIRLNELGKRMVDAGHFGLLPHFAKEIAYGRRTFNARSETVHKLASFRAAWARAQRCIIPAEAVYEPCWETGKAVRWEISQPGRIPFGIAGIFSSWRDPSGKETPSMSMLTVNAEGNPVFQRMHKPGDEKRMVVILRPDEYDDWLTCSVDEASRFFRQWTEQLEAQPKPLAPRTKRTEPQPPPAAEVDAGLF
jgi:putative SOS response-associated peptidase YedK